MVVNCAKCIYRSYITYAQPNTVHCVRWPDGEITKKDKYHDRCGEFIEGDPKFMNEVEEKRWKEDHPNAGAKPDVATATPVKKPEPGKVK